MAVGGLLGELVKSLSFWCSYPIVKQRESVQHHLLSLRATEVATELRPYQWNDSS